MKILIIQHKMIGDVLLTSLLCENIKKAFPNATVDYLINSNTLAVLENNPYIDNKIIFDNKLDKGLSNIIKFSKKIKKEHQYDLIIDVYSKIQTWIFVYYNNSPRKISFKKIGRTFLYTDNVEKHKEPVSNLGLAIEHRLALLKPLGIDKPYATEPKLYLTDEEIQSAKILFNHHHVNQSLKTVLISLLGSSNSKTYPLDQMANLVNFIGENYNVNILFNYFPKQINQAKTVYDQLSEVTKSKVYFELLGDDLRQFIAIANECDVIIGNDGGAINMGKALGKKSFTIFSPQVEKKIWATFEDGQNHISVHVKDYFLDEFNQMNKSQIKKMNKEFYTKFIFKLFENKLKYFLDLHIK